MTYEEVQKLTKDCIGPYCKSCPVCNGKACGNAMPGPGCKVPGNVAARNYEKWQEVCVNMDTLCPNTTPDLSFSLLGRLSEHRSLPHRSALSSFTTAQNTLIRLITALC